VATTLVTIGRNRKVSSNSGTIEQHKKEVKSMNEMNQEERRRPAPLATRRRARLFCLLQMKMVT
jgi:hypothetical protein